MVVGVDLYPTLIFRTGVKVAIDNIDAALGRFHPEHQLVPLLPRYRPLPAEPTDRRAKLLNHLQRLVWTQMDLPRQAAKHGCDVLFCTCHFSPFAHSVRTVTLFYDMAVWRHPEWYPVWWVVLNRVFAGLPAHRNAQLVTISQHSRSDMIELLQVPPGMVSSIYLGLDLPEVPAAADALVLSRYGLSPETPYVLHLGAAVKQKNLPRLVQAVSKVCRRLPPGQRPLLALGGSGNLHGREDVNNILRMALATGISDRVRMLGFVPRDHCTILYRNAAVYAFPSLFEGFGLPMIEAMACGIPVAASNRTSLPEIGGEAALYFDPLDPDSMADAIYTLLSNRELSDELRQRARIRAKMFTWERTADGLAHVFERAVNSKST